MGKTYYIGGMPVSDELYHSGIKGMHWGIRRFQNPDGSLTPEGRARYNVGSDGKLYDKQTGKPYGMSTGKKAAIGAGVAALGAGAALAADQVFNQGRGRQAIGQFANKAYNNARTGVDNFMNGTPLGYRDQYGEMARSDGFLKKAGQAVNDAKTGVDNFLNGTPTTALDANGQFAREGGLIPSMENTWNNVRDWSSNAAANVGKGAQNAWNNVSNGAKNAAENVTNAVLGTPVQGPAMDGKQLGRTGGLVNNAADWAKDRGQEVGQWLQDRGADVNEWWNGYDNMTAANPEMRNAIDHVNGVKDNIVNGAQNAWNNVSNAAQNAWNNVSNAAQKASNKVGEWWNGYDNMTAANPEMRRAIGHVNGVKDNIVNGAQNAWNNVSNGAQNAWNNVSNGAQNAWNNVSNAAQNASNKVGEWWNGYDNMTAANPEMRNAIDHVNGMKDNIANGAKPVADAVRNTAEQIGNGAQNAWNNVSNAAQNAWSNVSNAAQNTTDKAGDWFRDRGQDLDTMWNGYYDLEYNPDTRRVDKVHIDGAKDWLSNNKGSIVKGLGVGATAGLGAFAGVKIGQKVRLDNGQSGTFKGWSTLPNGQVIPIIE